MAARADVDQPLARILVVDEQALVLLGIGLLGFADDETCVEMARQLQSRRLFFPARLDPGTKKETDRNTAPAIAYGRR